MNSESGSTNQNLAGLPKPPDIYSDDRILLAWHRTHLANERTFLSWSRTSISLLAFGFVIERFDLFIRQWLRVEGLDGQMISHHSVVHLALFSFLLAGISIALSGLRFMQARAHINKGEAIFTIVPDILVIMSVVAIIVIAVVLSLPSLYKILGT